MLLARIEADWRSAGLDRRKTAMLAYVEKLTRNPGAMEAGDAAFLRDSGFEDADILAVVEVAAYYAYVNRIAAGLGVAVEPWVIEAEKKRGL